MFRNVRFYRLDDDWPGGEDALNEALEEARFQACGPVTERSSGWMPVDADSGDSLARRVNGADLLRLRSQSRVLPPAAVNEALDVRIDDYRSRLQEVPSARERRRLKAEVRDELLPKTLLKSDKIWGYVDLKHKLIGIDTALESMAERFLRRLGAPFSGLKTRPLQFTEPVGTLLTRLFLGNDDGNFALGRECRMQDPGDPRAKIRWSDFDLQDPLIRRHVAEGMQLTHLGIVYDNVLSCVLDENGVISKLRFLGVDDDAEQHFEAVARLDAEFVLLSGTLRRMLLELKGQLGGFA